MGQGPAVLTQQRAAGPAFQAPDSATAWRWIGLYALLLAVVGLGDLVLAWIPLRLGSPEWEFGTVAATMDGLPLVTMGFAGLLGSAIALGRRRTAQVVIWVVLVWAVLVLGALVLFLLDVPIALRATEGVAQLGIKKATAKTTFTAAVFATGYLVAGIGALRHTRSRS